MPAVDNGRRDPSGHKRRERHAGRGDSLGRGQPRKEEQRIRLHERRSSHEDAGPETALLGGGEREENEHAEEDVRLSVDQLLDQELARHEERPPREERALTIGDPAAHELTGG